MPARQDDYLEAANTIAEGGWSGARIYGALLPRCAADCGAEPIYTFNFVDFRQFAPPDPLEKICAP